MSLLHVTVAAPAGALEQEWHRQLQRSIVLVDDLAAGLLRPDASYTGVLPAASLRVLRTLFYRELQRRLCELALRSVAAAAAGGPATLVLSLELLGKVMATVKSVDAVPVCIPALSGRGWRQAHAWAAVRAHAVPLWSRL